MSTTIHDSLYDVLKQSNESLASAAISNFGDSINPGHYETRLSESGQLYRCWVAEPLQVTTCSDSTTTTSPGILTTIGTGTFTTNIPPHWSGWPSDNVTGVPFPEYPNSQPNNPFSWPYQTVPIPNYNPPIPYGPLPSSTPLEDVYEQTQRAQQDLIEQQRRIQEQYAEFIRMFGEGAHIPTTSPVPSVPNEPEKETSSAPPAVRKKLPCGRLPRKITC